MRLRISPLALAALILLSAFASQARARDRGDVYFGYSHVGGDLYAANTPGMNGWQAAAHIKIVPFVGVEGDFSQYNQTVSGYSQHVTLVMFGPRVTLHAAGFSVFAHGLAGIADESGKVTTFSGVGYTAASYALGGGADVPIFLGLKLRAAGDYLRNSMAPTAAGSGGHAPSHFRASIGAAYHF